MKLSAYFTLIPLSMSLFACMPSGDSFDAKLTIIPSDMKEIMGKKRYREASWSLYVKDLTDNKDVYKLNPHTMFTPASVSKLFTMSALLHTYGANYKFQTPVYALGSLAADGVFRGNVILVGSGDLTFGGRLTADNKIAYTNFDHINAHAVPTMHGEVLTKQDPLWGLKSLAKQIKQYGIKTIYGNVLIDTRLFETTQKRGYTLSPVLINENLLDFEVKPSQLGHVATLAWRPQIPQMRVINKVITVLAGQSSNIEVIQDPSGMLITLVGQIALDQEKMVNTGNIVNPAEFAKHAFVAALAEQGITVVADPSTQAVLPAFNEYSRLKAIAKFTSPPLIEFSKLVLKVSQNIGADLAPLLLAARHQKTSFAEGMRYIGNFLISVVHIKPERISFGDAAGGPENYTTPESVIKMLEYTYHLPRIDFEKNVYTLPILGQDGSLAEVAQKSSARGHVFAKTGTGITYNMLQDTYLLTAQSLAGYIKTKNGHWLAFVVAVNDAPLKTINEVIEVNNDMGAIANNIYENSN